MSALTGGFAVGKKARELLTPFCDRLGVPLFTESESLPLDSLLLRVESDALALGRHPALPEKPVAIDFDEAGLRSTKGKQLLVKAVGGGALRPHVLDATAGLGRDAAVLLAHEFPVTMVESHAVVHALLENALQRSSFDAELLLANAFEVMASKRWPVIYLDPMFEEGTKSAKVKKDLQLLHTLLGNESESSSLLDAALANAQYRVVVKRGIKADSLVSAAGVKPGFVVKGKAVRFDVYPLSRFGND